ncbi:MAG TPA: GNAT family N-acetyltransferase [Chloroflexia bacterium]|nr:GNAT family N-acetyltransferase [Chloroflexia bacterium]
MADEPTFSIRPATLDDIAVLAHHRCAMFRDMGRLHAASGAELAAASERYFAAALPAGEYWAWLVAPAARPATIVAGGGLQLRQILPRPDAQGRLLAPGPQGLVVNVYTEPDWRRRGLAELVMHTIVAWSREHGVASLVLHASPLGRTLYERLGWVASNEMFYPL